MAFVSGHKSRLLVGDFNLAAYTRDVKAPWEQDMLDATVLTDGGVKKFVAGQETSSFNVEGLYDLAEHADLSSWKSGAAQPITFGPNGFALGSEVWMSNGLLTSFELGTSVSDMATFSLNSQTDGATDMGVSLHDLTAVTADESGTAVDGTAATSNGAVAHLHVTDYSGLTSAVVIVEDSANNSTWATIGTFATATAVTAERLVIAGAVRRYTRYSVDVTGTGSVTFAVGLARR